MSNDKSIVNEYDDGKFSGNSRPKKHAAGINAIFRVFPVFPLFHCFIVSICLVSGLRPARTLD